MRREGREINSQLKERERERERERTRRRGQNYKRGEGTAHGSRQVRVEMLRTLQLESNKLFQFKSYFLPKKWRERARPIPLSILSLSLSPVALGNMDRSSLHWILVSWTMQKEPKKERTNRRFQNCTLKWRE